MARERITSATNDVVASNGGILMSLVQGEQKELAVVLKFLTLPNNTDYEYEAVCTEGINDGAGTYPSAVQAGGAKDNLNVRLCTYKDDWVSTTPYDQYDVVDYRGSSYILLEGSSRVSSTIPSSDPYWATHDKRTVYVQFPKTLSVSTAYTQQPLPDVPVYGFFELRVTESSGSFPKTWKPARGLVEFLFSPTELMP